MLTPTGSGPGQVNKKDHIFLLKLLGITLVAATATLAIEQLDVIKSLVPNNYSVFVTALLAPLLTWIVQWASDNRKEIEESVDDKPPAPPMVCWLPLLLTLSIPGTLFSQEITATSGDGQQTNTFQPYTLIKLKCDGEGKSYVWIVRRLPDGFRPDTVRIENGKELVWTGPPGMYDIDSIFTDNNESYNNYSIEYLSRLGLVQITSQYHQTTNQCLQYQITGVSYPYRNQEQHDLATQVLHTTTL